MLDQQKKIIRNEWGIMRQYNNEVVSHPLHGPIHTLEDAINYVAPDPTEDFRFDYLRELVKDLRAKDLSAFISMMALITAII